MKKISGFLLCLLWCQFGFGQTVADSLTIVNTQWETGTVKKGIVRKHAHLDSLYSGPQNINIVEISPKAARVKFGIAVANPNIITSKLADSIHSIVAINGSYFNIKVGNSVCFLKIGNQVIDSSAMDVLKARANGAIIANKNKLQIVPWNSSREKAYRGNKGFVLSSGPIMLYNDSVCDFSKCSKSFVNAKNPRSAIYITRDNKIGFITIDGRFKGKAEGMSIIELSHFLKIIGARAAINLDGGGSTTLWTNEAPENGVLNMPCDNKKYDHSGERKVANIIYVY
jgi:exopolysaccharide biosynthesis protein